MNAGWNDRRYYKNLRKRSQVPGERKEGNAQKKMLLDNTAPRNQKRVSEKKYTLIRDKQTPKGNWDRRSQKRSVPGVIPCKEVCKGETQKELACVHRSSILHHHSKPFNYKNVKTTGHHLISCEGIAPKPSTIKWRS